jgi:hypothetical protein
MFLVFYCGDVGRRWGRGSRKWKVFHFTSEEKKRGKSCPNYFYRIIPLPRENGSGNTMGFKVHPDNHMSVGHCHCRIFAVLEETEKGIAPARSKRGPILTARM